MKNKGTKETSRADGWWSVPVPRWAESGDAVFAHWHRFERAKPRLDDETALVALRFGFGARLVFGEHKLWADLAPLLEEDWKRLDGGDHAWDDVQSVVKKGWTRAANVDPIEGDTMVAEPLHPEPQVEAHVPGGRMDRHNG